MRWPLEPRGAARGKWHERESVIVAVQTEDGATGLGEAAPLPGMSIDSIGDAVRAAADLAGRVPIVIDSPGHATGVADRITAAPAARFAIETALLAALAQHSRTSIAALWSPIPHGELRSAVVCDDAESARAAVAAGARCVKLKANDPELVL
ncbi:MAG TPA: hypothetical protein VFQ65_18785, partial [Kofleriaceae bacterium]|nr:hypothetical protein [Kofleriaceae bacterium]